MKSLFSTNLWLWHDCPTLHAVQTIKNIVLTSKKGYCAICAHLQRGWFNFMGPVKLTMSGIGSAHCICSRKSPVVLCHERSVDLIVPMWNRVWVHVLHDRVMIVITMYIPSNWISTKPISISVTSKTDHNYTILLDPISRIEGTYCRTTPWGVQNVIRRRWTRCHGVAG